MSHNHTWTFSFVRDSSALPQSYIFLTLNIFSSREKPWVKVTIISISLWTEVNYNCIHDSHNSDNLQILPRRFFFSIVWVSLFSFFFLFWFDQNTSKKLQRCYCFIVDCLHSELMLPTCTSHYFVTLLRWYWRIVFFSY